jgi:glycerate kinase
MKFLIAPDKFKGSLSALEVCQAIGRGLKKSEDNFEIAFHPMADGGDGSLMAISSHLHLEKHLVETIDPLGRPISAFYFSNSDSAFIEMANASGLVLLAEKDRNPVFTSTLGTGLMIRDAISKGFQNIYIFLGGSATNDAGMGIAVALGFQFLDDDQQELQPIGENLLKVSAIKTTNLFDFEIVNITLLCDVDNPLFGAKGAAHVYAPQKGATKEEVLLLDNGLRHFSKILKSETRIEVGNIPGSGAAGGIGAGLVALCGARLANGFETISKLTKLEQQIQSADCVISGEGKLDEQSLHGKVVQGVAELCKKHWKPLILFVGKNELDKKDLQLMEVKQVYSITENAKSLNDAILRGDHYLEELGFQFHHLLVKTGKLI